MPEHYVGAHMKRLEDPPLLSGNGRYVADIHLEGALHLALLRSTCAHGRVTAIDATAARTVQGVVEVLTHDDISEIMQEFPQLFRLPVEHPVHPTPLAREKVHYVGEPVACVVAQSRYAAEDALEHIIVEYDQLSPVLDLERALDPDAPVIHGKLDSNLCTVIRQDHGDYQAAAAMADRVLRTRLKIKCSTSMAMETRGVLASHDPSVPLTTLWVSTQRPHACRRSVAHMLGVDPSEVRVIAPDVGGGFGPKGSLYCEDILVPYLARRLRRPVKFIEDRHEHFTATYQDALQVHDVEVAVRNDGTLLGLRDHFVSEAGAFTPSSVITPQRTTISIVNSYHVPAFEIVCTHVFTNRVPICPVRGAGRPQGNFVMERMMDLIARELDLDRLEVRSRNLIQADEFPYDTGMSYNSGAPIRYDSGNYPALIERLTSMVDLPKFHAEQERLWKRGVYRGIGYSLCVESTGGGGSETACLEIDEEGRINVFCGSPSQGQGVATSLAQVCADEFGMSPEQINVRLGDTNDLPRGIGTFSSRAAIFGANSTLLAAQSVIHRLKELAAEELEARVEDLELGGGMVRVRGSAARARSLKDLAAMHRRRTDEKRLAAIEVFKNSDETFASGAQLVVAEVDVRTGFISLLRYGAVHDCGTVLNALIVEGQVQGGVAHGIGEALLEEIYYDEHGQCLVGSFMDYPMPSAFDVPNVEMHHIATPSPWNPLGTKGAGEGGTIAALAAIASAVENALRPLNIRITDLPLHPPKLAALIHQHAGDGLRTD